MLESVYIAGADCTFVPMFLARFASVAGRSCQCCLCFHVWAVSKKQQMRKQRMVQVCLLRPHQDAPDR